MQKGKVFPAWILMCWPCRASNCLFSPMVERPTQMQPFCSEWLHLYSHSKHALSSIWWGSQCVGPKGIQPLLEQHNHALAVVYNDHYRHCGFKMMHRWWETKPNTPWRSSVEYSQRHPHPHGYRKDCGTISRLLQDKGLKWPYLIEMASMGWESFWTREESQEGSFVQGHPHPHGYRKDCGTISRLLQDKGIKSVGRTLTAICYFSNWLRGKSQVY